jgi:hypothetical protein
MRERLLGDTYRATVSDVQSLRLNVSLLDF